jgi:hypothetical protein
VSRTYQLTGLSQVERRLLDAAASGELKHGSGSYTRGILYDADSVILTKALAANPHDILKAMNHGALPYKPCGTRVSECLGDGGHWDGLVCCSAGLHGTFQDLRTYRLQRVWNVPVVYGLVSKRALKRHRIAAAVLATTAGFQIAVADAGSLLIPYMYVSLADKRFRSAHKAFRHSLKSDLWLICGRLWLADTGRWADTRRFGTYRFKTRLERSKNALDLLHHAIGARFVQPCCSATGVCCIFEYMDLYAFCNPLA